MTNHLAVRCAYLAILGTAVLTAGSAHQTLFDAVRNGDMARVRTQLESGADIESIDEHGNTLLMHAAIYGEVADMRFLLTRGANPKAANKNGHTVLMRASQDLAKAKLLIDHGANVNAAASDGTTPLMIAAFSRGSQDLLRLLIQRGAEIHATNKRGLSAMMIAAEQGSFANLKTLLEAGGDGNSLARNIASPNRRAVADLDPAVIEQMKKRAEGVSALMNAARGSCEPCVRLLLEHGADAPAKTGSGLTALHRAAYRDNPAMVKLLLNAGAPVNVADDRGFTPLILAVNSRAKNKEVVRVLLDNGADISSTDASGRSVAEWAATGRSPEIMKLLAITPEAQTRSTKKSHAQSVLASNQAEIREAVEKSLTLLGNHGPKFFRKSGCVSCHNVSIPLMALSEARRRGYPEHEGNLQMVKQTLAALAPAQDNLLSGYCSVPALITAGSYALMSLHAAGKTPDLLTDGIVRCLLAEQLPDGSWVNNLDERPPLSPENGIPGTALSAYAVKLYAIPSLQGEISTTVRRARTYLLSTKPRNGDDFAFRLLGLLWTNAKQSQIASAARELIAQQRRDGGWAQTQDMDSDAYATAQSLAALSTAHPDSVNSSVYARGVSYLMRTREQDGTWHVRSRAFGFQPYFESGFPHGQDQWISMAATGWAAMALMPVAEPSGNKYANAIIRRR